MLTSERRLAGEDLEAACAAMKHLVKPCLLQTWRASKHLVEIAQAHASLCIDAKCLVLAVVHPWFAACLTGHDPASRQLRCRQPHGLLVLDPAQAAALQAPRAPPPASSAHPAATHTRLRDFCLLRSNPLRKLYNTLWRLGHGAAWSRSSTGSMKSSWKLFRVASASQKHCRDISASQQVQQSGV